MFLRKGRKARGLAGSWLDLLEEPVVETQTLCPMLCCLQVSWDIWEEGFHFPVFFHFPAQARSSFSVSKNPFYSLSMHLSALCTTYNPCVRKPRRTSQGKITLKSLTRMNMMSKNSSWKIALRVVMRILKVHKQVISFWEEKEVQRFPCHPPTNCPYLQFCPS
jgi:hypothetical protein